MEVFLQITLTLAVTLCQTTKWLLLVENRLLTLIAMMKNRYTTSRR